MKVQYRLQNNLTAWKTNHFKTFLEIEMIHLAELVDAMDDYFSQANFTM